VLTLLCHAVTARHLSALLMGLWQKTALLLKQEHIPFAIRIGLM
jgi:hypothetical protein